MIKALNRPIDIAIFVYFRFFAGIMLSQELINSIVIGKLNEYTWPGFHFNYQFFEWITPWPAWGMYLHYGVTILAGFTLALGIQYRLSAIIVFLGHSLLFLMEMSEYINHHYLYSLISFWLIFYPLDRKELPEKLPAWALYLLLFHMAIAYFFAGIAKLNPDWLSGRPMDAFLAARVDKPLGFLYRQSWAPLLFSWGGIIFDLLIVPALIWKRTRVGALMAAILFHASNVLMFGLATFPWFSLLMTSMFFDPSWPRRLPAFGRLLSKNLLKEPRMLLTPARGIVLGLYVLIHLLLPLRQHLYPGVTSWTEEGHMFSWRMMLRSKKGTIHFWVKDKKHKKVKFVDIRPLLTERQLNSLVGNPEMILQLAHHLKGKFSKEGVEVSVHASSRVGLNGRPLQEMIKPSVDLSSEVRSLAPYKWILPESNHSTLHNEAELSSSSDRPY